jgi:hypothetical protein
MKVLFSFEGLIAYRFNGFTLGRLKRFYFSIFRKIEGKSLLKCSNKKRPSINPLDPCAITMNPLSLNHASFNFYICAFCSQSAIPRC